MYIYACMCIVYICICGHIYIYLLMAMYIYVYIQVYIWLYMNVYIHVDTAIYISFMRPYIYMYIYMYAERLDNHSCRMTGQTYAEAEWQNQHNHAKTGQRTNLKPATNCTKREAAAWRPPFLLGHVLSKCGFEVVRFFA